MRCRYRRDVLKCSEDFYEWMNDYLSYKNELKYQLDRNEYFFFLLVTLFQIPQYEHLQILICNGNSLTSLAGVEHIKHLWKLDVGNNQVNFHHFSMSFYCSIIKDSKSSAFITFYRSWFFNSF